MCEHISHIAVCDDIARIVSVSPIICQPFKEAFSKQREFARLGCITRAVDLDDALTSLSQGWNTRRREEHREKKLAYVLGHICHMPADKILNKLDSSIDSDSFAREREMGMATPSGPHAWPGKSKQYQDLHLFKTVFDSGVESASSFFPFSPHFFNTDALPGSRGFEQEQMEELFRVLMQRAFLSLHRFNPGKDNLGRINRIPWQPSYVSIREYAETYRHPDTNQFRKSVLDVNFYNPKDEIIQLTRGIQQGETPENLDVEDVVNSAKNQSQYAQILALGYGYIRAASRYWQGSITIEGLRELLPEGKEWTDDNWDRLDWKIPVIREQRGFL